VPEESRPSEPLQALRTRVRRRLPSSPSQWAWLAATVASALVVAWHAARVLAPVLTPPARLGHGWDQAEALRFLVMKSLRVYHALPSYDPYACGGHPAWASPDGDPNLVSPLLPAYLVLSLPAALHVEIVFYALASAIGTWLLASRFTQSPALRALAVVVFAFDGRWALQLAGGHLWHGAYALVPWILFFLDRAIGAEPTQGPARRGDVVWAGACLALLVYAGGAYPWPQTVILLGVYALWLAIATRQKCVPMAISGTASFFPRGALIVRPGRKMRMTIGTPIDTAQLHGADRESLTRQVEESVRALFRTEV